MIQILYEDNHCLAVNKPAGLLTQGDISGEPTVVEQAGAYLKDRYHKSGNVFVGLVHRLAAQFRAGTVEKIYWAIVEGTVPEEAGAWSDTLWKDERQNIVRVVPSGTARGKDSGLAFRVLGRRQGRTVLELRPWTGRSHQLRVQLAARGFPIVGDRKYGARSLLRALDGKLRVALHARSLTFNHPTRGEAIAVLAPVAADWPASIP
jgi:23S rRNA pseudouridine1911/1915/1917 synthase